MDKIYTEHDRHNNLRSHINYRYKTMTVSCITTRISFYNFITIIIANLYLAILQEWRCSVREIFECARCCQTKYINILVKNFK